MAQQYLKFHLKVITNKNTILISTTKQKKITKIKRKEKGQNNYTRLGTDRTQTKPLWNGAMGGSRSITHSLSLKIQANNSDVVKADRSLLNP